MLLSFASSSPAAFPPSPWLSMCLMREKSWMVPVNGSKSFLYQPAARPSGINLSPPQKSSVDCFWICRVVAPPRKQRSSTLPNIRVSLVPSQYDTNAHGRYLGASEGVASSGAVPHGTKHLEKPQSTGVRTASKAVAGCVCRHWCKSIGLQI